MPSPRVAKRNPGLTLANAFSVFIRGSSLSCPAEPANQNTGVQAFKILGYARRNEIFSPRSVRALRTIKYCALTTALFIVGAEAYIFIFVRGTDDVAGGVMMGAFIILVSAIVATAAAVFDRILQNAVEKNLRNDLTV